LFDYKLDCTLNLQDIFIANKTKLQEYRQEFRHKPFFLSSSKPQENTADFCDIVIHKHTGLAWDFSGFWRVNIIEILIRISAVPHGWTNKHCS